MWTIFVTVSVGAQEPAAWGPGEELEFSTFSIAAVDPATGEVGVAVTTRNPCVGNGVPWVRVGVGAVATQASTRTEYGEELLDLLAEGRSAEAALRSTLDADERAAHRQIGVIGLESGGAQHTGSETRPWSGHRAGADYVTQGNLLKGPAVLEAVARSFESTEGTSRHLADRLIAALEAGQSRGGDARKGRARNRPPSLQPTRVTAIRAAPTESRPTSTSASTASPSVSCGVSTTPSARRSGFAPSNSSSATTSFSSRSCSTLSATSVRE